MRLYSYHFLEKTFKISESMHGIHYIIRGKHRLGSPFSLKISEKIEGRKMEDSPPFFHSLL